MKKRQYLTGFSLVFLWITLIIYEAVLQSKIANIFLAFIVLSMIAGLGFSFPFRQLVKAHMPYFNLILIWGIITKLIDLLTSPSVQKSTITLAIGFVIFVYVWYKTKERRKEFYLEMKKMKQEKVK